MTDADLEACCDYWRRILRVQDWETKIRFVSHAEMCEIAGPNTVGNVSYQNESQRAQISILRPDDLAAKAAYDRFAWGYDVEAVVIHELLHLHTAPLVHVLTSGSIEERFEEQLIAKLTSAFALNGPRWRDEP